MPIQRKIPLFFAGIILLLLILLFLNDQVFASGAILGFINIALIVMIAVIAIYAISMVYKKFFPKD